MAYTYSLLSSQTLTSASASVTFNNIPSNYTDLVLRISARDTSTSVITGSGNIKFNGSSTNIYSVVRLTGDGTAASSTLSSNIANVPFSIPGSNAGMSSNTFNSVEIYIPSYTASQNKPIGQNTVVENNSTTAGYATIQGFSHLYRDTAAISSLVVAASSNFAIGSSFYLYGIRAGEY